MLVGNQEQRTRSILGNQLDPLQIQAITAMQWALLERIGRARYAVENTNIQSLKTFFKFIRFVIITIYIFIFVFHCKKIIVFCY